MLKMLVAYLAVSSGVKGERQAGCYGVLPVQSYPDSDATPPPWIVCDRHISVFNVTVCATDPEVEDKHLERAAFVMGRLMNPNGDFRTFSPASQRLQKRGAVLSIHLNEERKDEYFEQLNPDLVPEDPPIQDLHSNEMAFPGQSSEIADATFEEVFDLLNHHGLRLTYPELFGVDNDSFFASEMEHAIEEGFYDPSKNEECDEECQVGEFIWFCYATRIGYLRDNPSQQERYEGEWTLHDPEDIRQHFPEMWHIFDNVGLPSRAPDEEPVCIV